MMNTANIMWEGLPQATLTAINNTPMNNSPIVQNMNNLFDGDSESAYLLPMISHKVPEPSSINKGKDKKTIYSESSYFLINTRMF